MNIIVPCTAGSSKWCLSLWFPHQNPVCTSPLLHTFYMLRPSPYWFGYHPAQIRARGRGRELLNMKCDIYRCCARRVKEFAVMYLVRGWFAMVPFRGKITPWWPLPMLIFRPRCSDWRVPNRKTVCKCTKSFRATGVRFRLRERKEGTCWENESWTK